ncbi:hypothetical protein [Anaerotignum sp.]|uniref:hypothetical protein n=1 Tax=Anaerotignum sp. TaxID=2039241 RepID=UPI002A916BFC|nr:hypothetical protein [Anaerotignum sp.]MCI7658296.1 hypothetical protein [Clostridia bacterium]MDY5415944.1 hypothetical protein [Anaerotignum sp.]
MKKWQKVLFALICVIAIGEGAVIATWHKADQEAAQELAEATLQGSDSNMEVSMLATRDYYNWKNTMEEELARFFHRNTTESGNFMVHGTIDLFQNADISAEELENAKLYLCSDDFSFQTMICNAEQNGDISHADFYMDDIPGERIAIQDISYLRLSLDDGRELDVPLAIDPDIAAA